MERRVVITGLGAVTPIGNDVGAFWKNVKAGVCGIDFVTKTDVSNFRIKVAAEIRDFNDERYIEPKEAKRMAWFSRYAVVAALQALADSGLGPERIRENYRVGVIVGSGIGAMRVIEENVIKFHEKGMARISLLYIPTAIVNMAAGNVALKLGAKGPCTSIVTACATGANCIGEAFRYVKHGYADIMFAGGSEGAITPSALGGFGALRALSESKDPKRASIPFDKDRDGFVLGEGAACVTLESLEGAKARNAKIYAEIVGYGSTCDAYHITAPEESGESASVAMEMALEEAGISKSDVGYINAHGTSTELNDLAETKAIKLVFGDEAAKKIPVSSLKSMTGHLLGAAGAAEAISTALTLKEGFVPPTAGLITPGEGCDLDYVPGKGRQEPNMKYALSNSFGFGGHNAVLCLKKWEG
ncbi:MAG: beta-ketoacyl-ACP synthase II [Clostridiales bacterium]|jgi:3-oxoacyl-[acyl-carrier-protein] synthase II|nr:beta-ketoacyl-ACP synthase II [Clostridiales bacterium]